MRKNFGPKPWMYPMPVLILGSYDENGVPDAMNAAWGGISEEDEITVCVDSSHKTMANILKRGAFTVSFAVESQVIPCDYVGIVSANEVSDKFQRAGFTAEKSEWVDAPLICQLPMAMECRVRSYDDQTCRLVGEIVNVSASDSVLDEKGKVDPKKLRPIVYDPCGHGYYALGEKVGAAFSDGLKLK
ncbi:MAG: flavin reductase family protein [Clostridia bacterium]|nr:flavin reductase family protein [Clostridia bacterium]